MEIVINRCFGGFSVSRKVYKELGIPWDKYGYLNNEDLGIEGDTYAYRADKRLIKAIKKIGVEKASGEMAKLEIVEIPDDVKWKIDEYDGKESIHEKHRSW